MNLPRFRVLQVSISSLIFVVVFFYFLTTSPKSITEIQLSFWGAHSANHWIWNASLALLSITMFINVYYYIVSIPRLMNKRFLLFFFFTISLGLFLTAVFNIGTIKILHNASAFYYFFSCPLAIFLLAHTNHKNLLYKEWITHIIFSVIILCAPLSIIHFFKGMAISETIHSSLILCWNFWLLKVSSEK